APSTIHPPLPWSEKDQALLESRHVSALALPPVASARASAPIRNGSARGRTRIARIGFIGFGSFLCRGGRRAAPASGMWTFRQRPPGRRPAPPAASARLPEGAGRRR